MDLYELEIAAKKSLFRKSYYEFFKWSFNILEPQTRLEDTFHIKYLCDLLQAEVERIRRREVKGKDYIINIPPRTSKSKIISQCLLAWVWIDSPQLKMIAVSYSDKLTLSNSQYSKDIIKSDEYQLLFSECFQIRRDIDSKEQFANDKGGVRLSTTVGGTITGFGAELILIDDPQDPSTAESEVEREKVIRYYIETLYNRLTPLNLGVRVLLQQRLHVDDLSGYLKLTHPDDFHHVCLPAELTDNVLPVELREKYVDGLLDPIRLGRTELIKLKKKGTRYYAGQYLQTPYADGGGIIKGEWFDKIQAHTLTREPINEPIHFIIDSAYTAKQENDPTAIMVCFVKNKTLYILDVVEVWLEFPELIKYIKNFANKYQLNHQSKIFIEGAASGKSIVQELRATTGLNIIEIEKPKDDKVTRANAITATCEARHVKLVIGTYIENFISQLESFPNGKHDDMLDTLIHAVMELLFGSDQPDVFWL